MCDEIYYSQECTPAEIAMIIAGYNPDIRLSKRHREMLTMTHQQRQNKARQRTEAIKDSNREYFESVFLTESASLKAHSKRKQTDATKDWIRKVFAENQSA